MGLLFQAKKVLELLFLTGKVPFYKCFDNYFGYKLVTNINFIKFIMVINNNFIKININLTMFTKEIVYYLLIDNYPNFIHFCIQKIFNLFTSYFLIYHYILWVNYTLIVQIWTQINTPYFTKQIEQFKYF